MLDRDLAEMYGVEVRVLNQSVKRNTQRFPEDFMFQLSNNECEILKSQFVISRPNTNNLVGEACKNFPMHSLNKELRCYPRYSGQKEQFM